MGKITKEERHLYTRYFYNSVIEFVCFVILYLEISGSTSLSNINKYVKLFKTEVTDLISSFRGEVSADKLIQLLKTLNCFIICGNEVTLDKNIKWKDVIFEDFVISKCVDLLLKQQNNISIICKNLNLNKIIKLSRPNLLHIIEKYSFISVCSDQTVKLHHLHGLIGFEDHICKSVIGYFHDILCHSNALSYEDIETHSKSLSLCGLNNMIKILSMLYCSDQFDCQGGYISLSKKSKRYLEQKPIHMEKLYINVSSKSMHIGQIVFGVYGPFLHQWSGEIGIIKKNYGVIYCVVDFTNGSQGVFSIFFPKAALKVISELDDLQNYINVRDIVEFDAEFYKGKMLDRCWKATRVKLCNNKFKYDESLSVKLNEITELERHECSNNKCCSKINPEASAFDPSSQNVKNENCEGVQIVQKKMKTSDYESSSSSDSNSGVEINSDNNFNVSDNQISSTNFCFDAANESDLGYLFMFAHIYLLMEDKGIAIAKCGRKFYNILFMKDSIYVPNISEHFLVKGQKILAVIPYVKNIRNFDSFYVSILVYGLNETEAEETESLDVSPKEFAGRMLFTKLNILCNTCYNFSCALSSLPQEFLDCDLSYKIQLTELYDFIKSQYKSPFIQDELLLLLHNLVKTDLNDGNLDLKVFKFFMNMLKYLPRSDNKRENKRKIANLDQDANCRPATPNILLPVSPIKSAKKRFCSENDVSHLRTETFHKRVNNDENELSNLHLTLPSDSLSSLTSFGSYKTCTTNCSEAFYSCESESCSPKQLIFDNDDLDIPKCEISFTKMKTIPEIIVTKPLPALFNKMCTILSMMSSHHFETKEQKQQLKKSRSVSNLATNKFLSFQSVTSFKCAFDNQKRSLSSSSVKTTSKSCIKNTLELKAQVSLVSESFIFFSANINSQDIVLPFPKKDVPPSLLENVKLNSSCEIRIIPNVVSNLSHILSFRIFI